MDKACEFCGSPTKLVSTDFYAYPDAEEPTKTPCCEAQKRNMKFIKNRFDPNSQDNPDIEDVSRWEP